MAEETPQEQPRRPLFTPPNIREDIRLLPSIWASRRALWIPVVMLLVGFVLMYALMIEAVPPEFLGPVEIYIQFFFVPYGLFTFFIGGFLAPRASYMIGFLLGALNGILWTVLFLLGAVAPAGPGAEPTDVSPTAAALQFAVIAIVYGTLAAAFAAWYRDFLRQMQARGQQRRAEREEKEKARRREERRLGKRAG